MIPALSCSHPWHPLRRVLLTLSTALLVLMSGAIVAPGQDRSEEGWIPLFNGKDLDGWKPKIKGYEAGENYGDTFRVEDGVLKVSYDH
jgi:Domain of Unknown Function (DUF1080)